MLPLVPMVMPIYLGELNVAAGQGAGPRGEVHVWESPPPPREPKKKIEPSMLLVHITHRHYPG